MPKADMEPRDAEVEWDGQKVRVTYRKLTFPEESDARDEAIIYDKRGTPNRIPPFRYAREKLVRMLLSIDGVPFHKLQVLEWPSGFGDRLIQALGLLEADTSGPFPGPPPEGDSGT